MGLAHRMLASIATTPTSPSNRGRRCVACGVMGPVSSRTARQGPIAGAGGDHPGMRPCRVTRCQRNCWLLTRFVFHRGRGRLRFISSVTDRKPMTSSLSGRNRDDTSTQ